MSVVELTAADQVVEPVAEVSRFLTITPRNRFRGDPVFPAKEEVAVPGETGMFCSAAEYLC